MWKERSKEDAIKREANTLNQCVMGVSEGPKKPGGVGNNRGTPNEGLKRLRPKLS